jgi:hypothetical protein
MINIILSFILLPFVLMASDDTTIDQLLTGSSTNQFKSYTIQGKLFNANTNDAFPYTMTFKSMPNTGLDVTVDTPLSKSRLSLNTTFDVMSATFNVRNAPLIEKLAYDTRTGHRNSQEEVVFNYYLDGKNTRTKGVYYTKNTLDTFSLIPVLQHISDQSFRLIRTDLSVQHMAVKVPVLIQKDATNTLTQYLSIYTINDDLNAWISATKGPYFVFTLKVTGWQGLLYNHRHYYVFSARPPYRYIAHWGGANKMNLFSWAQPKN